MIKVYFVYLEKVSSLDTIGLSSQRLFERNNLYGYIIMNSNNGTKTYVIPCLCYPI